MPRALIADDEPLLRERLRVHLQRAWPELDVVAEARNGSEAVEAFDTLSPDIVFLDVQMPGLNGIDAARAIGRRARIVFITAYEQYAVQAFEQGAIDYLVKPFDAARLDDTVRRLKERLATSNAVPSWTPQVDALLNQLAAALGPRVPAKPALQWIKASVGQNVKLIPADEVIYLRSDEKYTLVVWPGGEALIRKPLRELVDELDPQAFVQIHRSTIVNLHHVHQVVRHPNETAEVQLKGRTETLQVSRSYLHLFRQI